MNHKFLFTSSLSMVQNELRKEKEVIGWKEASLYHGNYACYISGRKDNLVVHHLYSFESIVKQSINELIEENKLDNHWFEEPYVSLELKERFLQNHRKKGLGVLLHKKIHNEFHRIYNRKNNTTEQFDEFRTLMTTERINALMEVPVVGDMVCSHCNKVTSILFDTVCPTCEKEKRV